MMKMMYKKKKKCKITAKDLSKYSKKAKAPGPKKF